MRLNRPARWFAIAVATCALASGCSSSAKADARSSPKREECQFGSPHFGRAREGMSGQFHVPLVLTTEGVLGRPCSMPTEVKVYLLRPDSGPTGDMWELEQSHQQKAIALTGPGSVQAELTYLRTETGRGWTPDYLVVALPNWTPLALKWPYGAVEWQPAATYPGTYVGPFKAR